MRPLLMDFKRILHFLSSNEDKIVQHLPPPKFVGDPTITESLGSNTWIASWSSWLSSAPGDVTGVSEEEVRRLRLWL